MKRFVRIIGAAIALIMVLANSSVAFAAEENAPVTIWNPSVQENFELPVAGSTGYALTEISLRESDGGKKVGSVAAGQMYTILDEGSTCFQVKLEDGTMGWVAKSHTMINLADVLPSIRYDATNSYDSRFRSCGEPMALTGTSLYTGKTMNQKIGYEEYNMPMLFTSAKKVAFAQATALSQGYTLVLYEAFRPHEVQDMVNHDLGALMKTSKTVSNAILNGGWGKGWFIATSTSNHQKGFAIDCSLAKVKEVQTLYMDGHEIKIPSVYEELTMPTSIHELSPAAAALAYGVDSKSSTAWTSVPMAKSMTDGAKLLRGYCTQAGMSPLASEWWHCATCS